MTRLRISSIMKSLFPDTLPSYDFLLSTHGCHILVGRYIFYFKTQWLFAILCRLCPFVDFPDKKLNSLVSVSSFHYYIYFKLSPWIEKDQTRTKLMLLQTSFMSTAIKDNIILPQGKSICFCCGNSLLGLVNSWQRKGEHTIFHYKTFFSYYWFI